MFEGDQLAADEHGTDLPDLLAESEAIRFVRGARAHEHCRAAMLEIKVRQEGQDHYRFACAAEFKAERVH